MDDCIYDVPVLLDADGWKKVTKAPERVKEDLRKYWDKDVINEKLAKVTDYKDKMLLVFLWMSGVRITEALSLHKQDIDLKNYTMKVRWLKSKKYNNRIVPLHPRLREILEMYTAPMNQEDAVFPYTRQRAWQIVKHWMAGNPHMFRHSFAVNWIRSGLDFPTLVRVLGHTNPRTTMEYYKLVPIDQGKELIKLGFE